MRIFGHIVDRNNIPEGYTKKRITLTTLCGKKRSLLVDNHKKKPLMVCTRCVDKVLQHIKEDLIPKASYSKSIVVNGKEVVTMEYFDEPN